MNELYPFRLKPHFDRRPWGARSTAPVYDICVSDTEEPIGEVWLTWDRCEVASGPFAGQTLGDLCTRFGTPLVGTAPTKKDRFPLLLKFLFPRDKLSVQVHPDDSTARRHGETCGKTECWYVVSAEPGSKAGVGLKAGVSKAELERGIRENRAEDLLEWIDLSPGDMIYVAGGTVHTLGPGAVVLETQQNSDTTYRLYDYGRHRELHIQKGLDAVKERTAAGKVPAFSLSEKHERLISAKHFIVERYVCDHEVEFSLEEDYAPQCLVVLDGNMVVTGAGFDGITCGRGDAVIVPACVTAATVRPKVATTFLKCSLP